jgi:hypothetical protein
MRDVLIYDVVRQSNPIQIQFKTKGLATFCLVQYGKHHIRFLVDNQWRLSPDLPTEMGENEQLENVIHVDACDSFHIFYDTSWKNSVLRCLVLDEDGLPANDVCFPLMDQFQHKAVV